MGKKSYSQRRKHLQPTPPTPPAVPTRHPAQVADPTPISEDGFDEVDHSDMNHGFLSYPEALQYCYNDGWKEAVFAPNFSSSALVDAVNAAISSNVEIVDKTPQLPRTCEGNYSMLPYTGYQLSKWSEEDHSKAYLLLRTKTNTPAFLCGLAASYTSMRNGNYEEARAHIRTLPNTPAGFLVHKGVQTVIPTLVCQGSEKLAASLLTAMIDSDPAAFCCSDCGDTILRQHGAGWGTTGFVAFACDHVFHPWCLNEHYVKGQHCCYLCNSDEASVLDGVANAVDLVSIR